MPAKNWPKIKKMKFEHPACELSDLMQVNIPLGIRWQNNSCTHDALFTVLFNIWRENPLLTTESWGELQCDLLDLLTQAFHARKSVAVNSSRTFI